MATTDYGTNVRHIVTNIQHIRSQIGMSYRALCGEELQLDPAAPYPTDDAEDCPACVRAVR